jgi:probable F420-dependent oxidoreductase
MSENAPAGLPRVGVGVPNFGLHASPEGIVAVATASERLGFHSVWTFERLLLPLTPEGTNPYGLPEHNGTVYDPLETLTWVAAHTRRIGLGTIVMNPLFQSPVVLAKRMATLDRLSGGRLLAGIGQGWMPEEFDAVGVAMSRRGAGFEEHVAAMRACWGPDPIEHLGRHYRIPRSNIGPKPVNGRVPLLIGGTTKPAVERAARLGDGFAAVLLDWEALRAQMSWYRDAGGGGLVVLRVNPDRVDAAEPGPPFTGPISSLVDDLARAGSAGVDVVVWDLNMADLNSGRQVTILEALTSALRAPNSETAGPEQRVSHG